MTYNPFADILSSDTFREEHFISEIQARLSQIMDEKGVTRAELARRLDVSRARVTQIFSDDCRNFTVRLLARSFLALEEEPVVIARSEYEALVNSQSSRSNSKDVKAIPFVGFTEAVIANLLRASVGERPIDNDRAKRGSADARDWATAGANVVPFRERVNG
jgi:transcriptional regulator with XRE-family HTH domain